VPSGTLVPLWEGEDLALHTALLEELEGLAFAILTSQWVFFPACGAGFLIQYNR